MVLDKADRKLANRWEDGVTSTLLRIAKAPGIGRV
jgi:hypothetical protein